MSLKIDMYGVLFFEPEAIHPGLRIAGAVLCDLERKINSRYEDIIIPGLAGQGLLPSHMSVGEFAARAHEVPDPIVKGLGIPTEHQFVVRVRPYELMQGIPSTLDAFERMYGELARSGIQAAFFNTAGMDAHADYVELARRMDEFPALNDATWVVTTSLREPMPNEFYKKAMAREPDGGEGRARDRGAATSLSCFVPIGDSIVMKAKDDAVNLIHDRLQRLKRMGRH